VSAANRSAISLRVDDSRARCCARGCGSSSRRTPRGVRDAGATGPGGSGMRGDKRRTVRTQDDQVVDTITGRSWRFKDYERGAW